MITARSSLSVALTTAGVVALAACASTTNGTLLNPGGSRPSTDDPAAFAASVAGAVRSASSARMSLSMSVAGQQVTGSGAETLSDGRATAYDLTETIPGAGKLRIVSTGGKTYAQLPAAMNTSGKPWVLISATSSNPMVKQLATSLNSVSGAASVAAIESFVQAASSVKDKGAASVDGVQAEQYTLTLDPSRLPDTNGAAAAMKQAGITSLPLDLYLDKQSRPVKVAMTFDVQGQHADMHVDVTGYNQPVTITAPPASQVSTD